MECDDAERADDSVKVWRNADHEGFHVQPFAKCDTVYSTFEYAVKVNGNRPALGERDVVETIKTVANDGREVEKLKLGGGINGLRLIRRMRV